MQKKYLLAGVVIAGFITFLIFVLPNRLTGGAKAIDVPEQETVEQKNERIERYVVAEGDVLSTALEHFSIPFSKVLAIVAAAEPVADFTKVRLGEEIRGIYVDEVLARLEYDLDSERMLIVDLTGESPLVRAEDIQYQTEIKTASFTISQSMYLSGIEAGLSDGLIISLADVFAWSVDFSTQVRMGDQVSVVYESRMRDGHPAGTGEVLAARFVNDGDEHLAYRFESPDGKVAHYDQDGNSLVRQFLKAPLKYRQITSGFTYSRFHPVLNTNTPHRAIDYAAALGTPIMAVGDGKVTFAGWNGGYGNYVDIRHNSVHETQYAHLSKIAVKRGQSVKQGDIIGYVGSTGYSTGPHLHYQLKVNGELVNPLSAELPAGDPVPSEQTEAFQQKRSELDQLLPR